MQTLVIDNNFVFLYFIILLIIIYFLQWIFQRSLIYFVHRTNNLIIDDIAFILSLGSKLLAGLLMIYMATVFYNLASEVLIFYSLIIGSVVTLSSIQEVFHKSCLLVGISLDIWKYPRKSRYPISWRKIHFASLSPIGLQCQRPG